MSSTPTLDARLRSATFRLRVTRALDAAVLVASLSLGALGLAALGAWLGRVVLPSGLGYVPVLAGALAALIAAARPIAPLAVLGAFDRSHGLYDLLASAWSFAHTSTTRHSAAVIATLARAERAAAGLDLSRAQPWRAPRGLGLFALALGVALLAWHGLPGPQPSAARVTRPEPTAVAERLISAEALAAFRAELARLDPEPRPTSGAAAALRAELDALLERMARAPLDRLAALRTLRALEARAEALASGVSDGRGESAADPAAEHSTPPTAAGPGAAAAEQPPPAALPEQPSQRGAAPGGADPSQPLSPGTPGGGSLTAPPGGVPQPIAAAPGGRGEASDAKGPQLERRPVPSDPERARGLSDAIAELRELLRREPQNKNQALGTPHTPDGSEPSRERADRPGAAAATTERKPEVGQAAQPEPESAQLPAAPIRVEAQPGRGPSRSEVIYGAAERGFAGRDYARVHAEYEAHADRELEREPLPPGYRGYVRRYFQAIAPGSGRPKPPVGGLNE